MRSWKIDGYYSSEFRVSQFILNEYARIFGVDVINRFSVAVLHNKHFGPITCPKRLNPSITEDYQIFLSNENNYHCQFVFQFAHEISHLIMECYPQYTKFKWVSECLCEAASLYMLHQCDISNMDKDVGYKTGIFREYLERQINKAFGEWPNAETIPTFFEKNSKDFESNPYGPVTKDRTIRWRNMVIGDSIYDIILKNPFSWKSICGMKDFVSEQLSSIDFLVAWEKECKENTVLPRGILNLLGF